MQAADRKHIAAIQASRIDLEALLLNAIETALIATDLDGKIIHWNRGAESLYGWAADEVLGQHILDVTPTSQSRVEGAEILRKLQSGETCRCEFSVRHKSGRWFKVHVTDSPVYDSDGKLVGIVGVSIPTLAGSSVENRTGTSLRDAMRRLRRTVLLRSLAQPSPQDASVRSIAVKFGIALLILAGAIALRFLLDAVIPARLPFITFFPAVMIAAFFCGLWPALLVLLATALLGTVLIDVPGPDAQGFRLWGFVLFTAFGAGNAAIVLYLKAVLVRLQSKEQQLAVINNELQHRIKNSFAIVSAICLRTIRRSSSPDEMAKAVMGRISALASAQNLIGVTATDGSDLRALIDVVVRPLLPTASRLQVDGVDLLLPQSQTTSFALILHELATNALKHGAWAGEFGSVLVEWRVDANSEVDFSWREQGGAPATPAVRDGLGRELIRRGLVGADVVHEIGPTGLNCRIRFMLLRSA